MFLKRKFPKFKNIVNYRRIIGYYCVEKKKAGMVGIKNIQYHLKLIVFNLAYGNICIITSL